MIAPSARSRDHSTSNPSTIANGRGGFEALNGNGRRGAADGRRYASAASYLVPALKAIDGLFLRQSDGAF